MVEGKGEKTGIIYYPLSKYPLGKERGRGKCEGAQGNNNNNKKDGWEM